MREKIGSRHVNLEWTDRDAREAKGDLECMVITR